MALCPINKIDSNITGLSYAEEVCLKRLPTLADDGADPIWYGLEPNSYSGFGGELSTITRAPIDPSRQNKKGVITDLDASGGFNVDFTRSNLTRLMQGFFFADAREMPSTQGLNTKLVEILDVDATGGEYGASTGLDAFGAGQLVYASGFAQSANNGLKTVVSASAGALEVSEPLTDETPPANAKITAVGWDLGAGASITVVGGIVSLVATSGNFLNKPQLVPGAWVFIGGDASASRFDNNQGFARIKSIANTTLVFDDITWINPVGEIGTGKSIQLFIGTVIKNEKDPALIKSRSYQLERTLGEGENGPQGQYLEGAKANEFTLNISQADKITADLSFTACDNTYKTGDTGDELKLGAHISAPGEDAYNTSSDLYRVKMSVVDSSTSTPAPLFKFVSEASITVNNNVTPNKAVGILGAFDTSAGNFEVGGSLTAYFATVAGSKAVRANADVGFSVIGAAKNAGFLFDIPLLGLGGGEIDVNKDEAIMTSLEPAGAENPNGYTLLYETFSYLPNAAMPQG